MGTHTPPVTRHLPLTRALLLFRADQVVTVNSAQVDALHPRKPYFKIPQTIWMAYDTGDECYHFLSN